MCVFELLSDLLLTYVLQVLDRRADLIYVPSNCYKKQTQPSHYLG